ncbi:MULTISPECIES: DUF4902 domain-containing protein [Acinetobacter]|jgi:hypothetical protein|uniref:DUF4902 domain-containing protein n=1 Tax=Acinetobacter pittii TaxID=48296 RepID=A0A242TZN4_ACIPI|nr:MULTISPECIES: DUF4902 domain-containing protein [Acinetobacter]MBJ8435231.1 DUF4902 domain-containing protein [Acinetobacter pittii]MBJ8502849.1 DUF4902 domain-containing protein [Acinetobacter pittii]MBJ9893821.1 DUF4902 domain-containing protein [Acinetobacter pittii]MBJ9937606.1 DUF4902 domain-containing protein [Acinetobacter pittii]MCU4479841.1 DUF4902 domain-containing protein [Acinetobacter sp. WU_MDCI_Abxd143]
MVSILPHFSISTDGFIRMNENQLMSYPLQHIISIVESTQIEDSKILYYGFTEWATLKTPALSTGWDWEFIEYNGITTVKRVGLPRSNIMIVDISGIDIGFDTNETFLKKKIDTLFWEPFIYAQINTSLIQS